MRCPKCGAVWNETDEKEYKRIERKNKREEKQLRMIYMKEIRNGDTTLDFDEWVEYKNKENK
jgi:hypothetical protein